MTMPAHPQPLTPAAADPAPVALGAGLLLLAAIAPATAVQAGEPPSSPSSGGGHGCHPGASQPTIQYEEALAHARRPDRVRRRASGSRSRSSRARSDRWTVGGGHAARRSRPAGCRARRCAAAAVATAPARRPRPRRAGRRRRPGRPALPRPGRPRSSAQPAAAVDPGGAQARGVRLPAVLGADRQLDPARLGEALDRRLLRRRRARQRRPPEAQQRRLDDGRLERLDELEDDRGHQRGPRQRRPGRADRPELRLVVDRRDPPEGAPRQPAATAPTSPARSRRPSATAAPTASTSTSSRSSSTYADEFTSLVRSVRSELEQGRPRLPADVRHDRLDRQLPDREGDRVRRRRRGRDHGLRLPRREVEPGRLGRADRRPDLRHRRHGRGLPRPHPGVEGHPGRAVLRPRLVDRLARRSTPRTSRARSTARRRPSSTATARQYAADHGTQAGPGRGRRPGPPTSARTARRRTAA